MGTQHRCFGHKLVLLADRNLWDFSGTGKHRRPIWREYLRDMLFGLTIGSSVLVLRSSFPACVLKLKCPK